MPVDVRFLELSPMGVNEKLVIQRHVPSKVFVHAKINFQDIIEKVFEKSHPSFRNWGPKEVLLSYMAVLERQHFFTDKIEKLNFYYSIFTFYKEFFQQLRRDYLIIPLRISS